MTATPAWPVQGPPHRDELVSWTTAESSDAEIIAIPALAATPAPGWTELIDGRGVFVRREPDAEGSTAVWFVHGLGGASTSTCRISSATSIGLGSPIATAACPIATAAGEPGPVTAAAR